MVLELYVVMRDAVEKVNFDKQAILVTLNDSVSHVCITCGQPDILQLQITGGKLVHTTTMAYLVHLH